MIQTRYSDCSHDDSREYPNSRTDEGSRYYGAKNQHRHLQDPAETSELDPTLGNKFIRYYNVLYNLFLLY